jgi:hypothetical protein
MVMAGALKLDLNSIEVDGQVHGEVNGDHEN